MVPARFDIRVKGNIEDILVFAFLTYGFQLQRNDYLDGGNESSISRRLYDLGCLGGMRCIPID